MIRTMLAAFLCSCAATTVSTTTLDSGEACSAFYGAPCDLPDASGFGLSPCCAPLACTPHGQEEASDGSRFPGLGDAARCN
jgi:hypothetical protein